MELFTSTLFIWLTVIDNHTECLPGVCHSSRHQRNMANPTQSLPSGCSSCLLGSSVVHTTETGCMREKTTPASGCQPLGLKAPSLFVKRYFIFYLLILLFQSSPSPPPLESMLNEGWNCLLFTHPGLWTLLGIYNISSINNCWLDGWMIGGWVDEWMNGWVDRWTDFNIHCQKAFLAGTLPLKGPLRVTSMGLCSYQLPGLVRTVTASTCHPYI